MPTMLIVYHSTYGHTETMAHAVAEGAQQVEGMDVTCKRVPELVPEEVRENSGAKMEWTDPVADPAELENYDAIIVGTPTRFGNMCSQMRNFFDQTGGQWAQGKLIGKVGSVFTSTGTGGGGETTITSTWNTLCHHGMIIVGLPYSSAGLQDLSEVRGGSPYGAATIAGPDGGRQPTEKEKTLARDQGKHVAQITADLAKGRAA